MMAKRTHLVSEHLENVAASVLEDYQQLIRDYIRNRHGIYALYKQDRLYYVGLASNMRTRLAQHLRDRHRGLWDRFSIYLVRNNHQMRELEALVLRIVRPKGNRQIGRLVGSENLKSDLSRDIRDHHRTQMREMFGKKKPGQKRRQAKRTSKESSGAILERYVDRPRAIRATYRGQTVRARIRKDGWICFNGYLYRSPSAAASDVCGRNCNGWTFWHYQRSRGEWVPLSQLR